MSHKRSQIFWHQEAFHSQTSDVRTASRLLRGSDHTFLASIQNETLVGDVGSEQLTVHMRHLFKKCRLASHRVQLMLKKHLWAQACAQVAAKAEKTARCKPFATSEKKTDGIGVKFSNIRATVHSETAPIRLLANSILPANSRLFPED